MKLSHLIIATATFAVTGLSSSFAEIDAKADAALKAMAAKLGKAKQLTVKAERTVAPALLENAAAIGSASIEASLQRPDKLKCIVKGKDKQREFYLGAGGSAIFSKENGFYVRFPGKPSIDESFDAAQAERGVFIPAQDLLSQDPYKDLTANAKSGKHVGEEKVGSENCDHLAFSQEGLDWEIWIAKSDQLPRKFVITVKGVDGKNHLVVDGLEWNLEPGLKDAAFVFTPPEGSTEIEFAPQEEEGEAEGGDDSEGAKK